MCIVWWLEAMKTRDLKNLNYSRRESGHKLHFKLHRETVTALKIRIWIRGNLMRVSFTQLRLSCQFSFIFFKSNSRDEFLRHWIRDRAATTEKRGVISPTRRIKSCCCFIKNLNRRKYAKFFRYFPFIQCRLSTIIHIFWNFQNDISHWWNAKSSTNQFAWCFSSIRFVLHISIN